MLAGARHRNATVTSLLSAQGSEEHVQYLDNNFTAVPVAAHDNAHIGTTHSELLDHMESEVHAAMRLWQSLVSKGTSSGLTLSKCTRIVHVQCGYVKRCILV